NCESSWGFVLGARKGLRQMFVSYCRIRRKATATVWELTLHLCGVITPGVRASLSPIARTILIPRKTNALQLSADASLAHYGTPLILGHYKDGTLLS
ncbi:hypothetical protein, partial [Pseudomonas sp. FH4]|uniref:hypothetical protein n=1 Tax=Pseudomonas sp. FH4 TaxID=1284393 RepID=UPI0019D40C51